MIATQQDETIPLWHTQTYVEGILGAKRIVLEDADHGLLQTHPAFYCSADRSVEPSSLDLIEWAGAIIGDRFCVRLIRLIC